MTQPPRINRLPPADQESRYEATSAKYGAPAYRRGQDLKDAVDNIAEATHGGTHIDAPLHFHKGGWSVADIPIERLMYVPIVKLDIRRQAEADPN
ncbi:hypothetical protein HPB49_002431 [Dermacentor silvarum]|uniref:Uncharacterized protein n=1 Tax=Dermacentor silvarum TaxID=543639 RepID=A0ACB8CUG7_DERSI|nr:hypothetical protein HPB49_002431 [Dermacentor silvarum]